MVERLRKGMKRLYPKEINLLGVHRKIVFQ